jgi:hypothetical protein
MARIVYVHWNQDEALDVVRDLRAAGHKVDYHWNTGEDAWRLMKDTPPDALVISLARLPSHGRAVAAAITESKRLRELPLVFVGGEPEKVAATKYKFPGAAFCSAAALKRVLAKLKPFVPRESDPRKTADKSPSKRAARSPRGEPTPAGYSGTPLPQKLGVKPNGRVALVNAPAAFDSTLGPLPSGVQVVRKLADGIAHDVIVLFVTSRRELERAFEPAARRIEPDGGLWVSWPKKASGVATDLTEDIVREIGLAGGLVDNKVCAVDATWSGLRFIYRAKDRPAKR